MLGVYKNSDTKLMYFIKYGKNILYAEVGYAILVFDIIYDSKVYVETQQVCQKAILSFVNIFWFCRNHITNKTGKISCTSVFTQNQFSA